MRVLHLSPALLDEAGRISGGGERYAYEIARHMAELTPVRLVSFGRLDSKQRVGELTVRIYGGEWINDRGVADPLPARRVAAEVRRADVIHCHQRNYRLSKFAGAVGRATGRRVFVTDHGGGPWGPGVWMPDRFAFTGHLFVSNFSRRLNGPPRGVPSAVIHGGVDQRRFRPASPTRRSGALFVGRLLPHKGLDVLLKALPDGMTLDIVGPVLDRRYWTDLQRLAERKAVRFHQNWDDARLIEAYQRARCVVLPSVYQDCYGQSYAVPELFGQALLEGMACGTPAICTDVGGMPEVVIDGETGYVVPSRDPQALRAALARMQANDGVVARMGTAARRRVECSFTWRAIAERCVRLYRELAA
jgi:glycosyltransferase involved in cell wall biosynthesis